MFKRLLIPVDFSEASEVAFGFAKLLAADATRELIHIVPHQDYSHPPYMSAQLAFGQELQDRVVTAAQEQMVTFVQERVSKGDNRPVALVVTGAVPDLIAEHAQEAKTDLIVMATHGRTGIRRWLMGSVTERVLRVSPCPVLVARQATPEVPAKVKKIVVGIDFSDHSLRALHLAAKIAVQQDATLECVHVWSSPYVGYSPTMMGDILDKLATGADQQLAEFLEKADLPSSLEVKRTIVSGAPAATLLDALEESSPDLLVLGTHGYGPVRRLVLGSVAEGVVRYAPCSALIVP